MVLVRSLHVRRPRPCPSVFAHSHRSIVIITSIIVAASAAAISSKFSDFSYVGGIIGSSISAAFLLLLGVANAYILLLLIRQARRLLRAQRQGHDSDERFKLEGAGVFFRVFKRFFKLVDRYVFHCAVYHRRGLIYMNDKHRNRMSTDPIHAYSPWKMYPLGVLFGLGFDTSSEIAILGISSIQATRGTSLWLILIFPLLFTAGMCMLDTIDGALMLCLYSSATLARDAIAIAYYNVILTAITILVAVVIGVLQVLGLVVAIMGKEKLETIRFWRGVMIVRDRYDVVGGVICGVFVVTGIASVLLYKPWRRWVDKGRPAATASMSVTPDGGEDLASLANDVALFNIADQYSTTRERDLEQLDSEILPSGYNSSAAEATSKGKT